jgi:hypothetical protein
MVGKKKVEEYEMQKAAEERKRAAKEAKEKEEKEEIHRLFQEEVQRKEKERLRQKAAKETKEKEEKEELRRLLQEEAEREEKVREALEALEAKAAKERDRSPKTTYSSGRDSGISFEPHRRDGKIIYVKQVYSDDDEAYVSSSGAGRREEYDRTGRTGGNVRARARRPSSGEFYNGW